TGAKVLGLVALSGVALLGPAAAEPVAASPPPGVTVGGLTLALVMVMFAYGGWADVTYVAAEVRNPRRNLWRALLLGTAAVAAIYLVGTFAFFRSLGFEGVSGSQAVAADVLRRPLGDAAARAISMLVCVSCLGAINGMVLTGSRVFFAVGQDHLVFRWLAAWNGRRGVPVRSMLVQSAVTLGLLLAFARSADGFERMVIFSTPPFWFFFLLAGAAVFVFRRRGDRAGHATYRVPLYPLTPILFCLSSLLLVAESTRYAWNNRTPEALWTVLVLLTGAALAGWEFRRLRLSRSNGFDVLQR
ncbi:MAG TPA: APC family permease, partial [Humisphaera sp.]